MMQNNIDKENKSFCTGCRACEQVCPKKSISFTEDEEGFLIPKVDKTTCIDCGICVKKCHGLNENKFILDDVKVYAAKSKNTEMIKKSTSGGIFGLLADDVLNDGGVVFGCAWTDKLQARHVQINNKQDLIKLHGSKYVQSDTGDTFSQVKKLLLENKKVLYSGTSCQIAGLKYFLGKEYDNLLTVDVICHGVPSQVLLDKYVDWIEQKYNKELQSLNFRSKNHSTWGLAQECEFDFGKKKIYKMGMLEPYYSSFIKGDLSRNCCYECKYANKYKLSDITLGDYWGIEKIHPDFFDHAGISVIMVNSDKGARYINGISSYIEKINSKYEDAAIFNKNLNGVTPRGNRRSIVYKNIDSVDNKELFERRLKVGLQLRRRIINMIPCKIKVMIKN